MLCSCIKLHCRHDQENDEGEVSAVHPIPPSPNRRNERRMALLALGLLWFNAPLLRLVNVAETVLGVPLVYWWLFGGWLGLIAALRGLR